MLQTPNQRFNLADAQNRYSKENSFLYMNIILIILGVLIAAIILFVIYRNYKVRSQKKKLSEQRFERIRSLYEKLERGENITPLEVRPFAENLLTRESIFELLREHGRVEIFPNEFNNIIHGAESNLANWLEFPTELDACPDEIEHMKRVTFDYDGNNSFMHYEVFKYRVTEPHWAAKDGWILGVVGPFYDDSKPYDFPHGTFSRIDSTIDKITPEEEAKWVHENIAMRG